MPAWSRRTALLAALALATAARAEAPPVVTLFGDSIAAGYGLAPDDGLASRLREALAELGVQAEVRNAGVPGDTSAGGRGRLDGAVRRDTAVCVVEFGGNDRRMGFPTSMTAENLDAIVKRLKTRGVAVILVAIGDAERRTAQRRVAEANGVPFDPDVFVGVGPALRQPDGIHPNAEGEKLIAASLAPLVAQALRGR
jgi:acyl-CoA thioesterase-1